MNYTRTLWWVACKRVGNLPPQCTGIIHYTLVTWKPDSQYPNYLLDVRHVII